VCGTYSRVNIGLVVLQIVTAVFLGISVNVWI
jgi:hypothetical protein